MKLQKIALAAIIDPHSPVRASIAMDGVEELAESIRQVGLLQPITVRPEGDRFEVVTGHRRTLACRLLQMEEVECLVQEPSLDADVVAARLHENLVRRDMSAVEEACVYAELYEQLQDVDKVAEVVKRTRVHVENRLALLDGDEAVRDALHEQKITVGVAQELNRVRDETTRRYLLHFAVEEGATVGKVRGWRMQYAEFPIQVGNEPARPESGDPAQISVPEVNVCWLCGSSDDPHDLRVRMVHTTCERIVRNNALQKMGAGAAIDGNEADRT